MEKVHYPPCTYLPSPLPVNAPGWSCPGFRSQPRLKNRFKRAETNSHANSILLLIQCTCAGIFHVKWIEGTVQYLCIATSILELRSTLLRLARRIWGSNYHKRPSNSFSRLLLSFLLSPTTSLLTPHCGLRGVCWDDTERWDKTWVLPHHFLQDWKIPARTAFGVPHASRTIPGRSQDALLKIAFHTEGSYSSHICCVAKNFRRELVTAASWALLESSIPHRR